MKTYDFIIFTEEMRAKNISEIELMQLCAGGGVEAFPSGAIVQFVDKNDAFKAIERLKAKGFGIGIENICEVDTPSLKEISHESQST
jgi:hypothetical protein